MLNDVSSELTLCQRRVGSVTSVHWFTDSESPVVVSTICSSLKTDIQELNLTRSQDGNPGIFRIKKAIDLCDYITASHIPELNTVTAATS